MNISVIGRGNVGGGLAEHLALMFAVSQAGLGPFFYRMWSPSR